MEVDVNSPNNVDDCTKLRNDKIGKVLKKFLDPNFKLKNDVYLNLFLSHLIGKNSIENASKESQIAINAELREQCIQWLLDVSSLWHNKQVRAPVAIQSFALHLASLLSPDDRIFVRLNYHNVYESLASIGQTNLSKDASVTFGFVKLLTSLLQHKCGVQWVLATTYWNDILDFGLNGHTLYIQKKAYEFVATLLGKAVCFNKQFCTNLVKLLIKPLKVTLDGVSRSESGEPSPIESTALFESLKPKLNFISEVTEILVKDKNTCAVNLFEEVGLIELVKKLQLLSQTEDFSYELIKIRCIILFSKLGHDKGKKEGSTTQLINDSISFFDVKTFFDLLENEMDKNHVRCVIKICHFAHKLYCNLMGHIPLCVRKGEPIEFENQMVLFQILPVMFCFSNNGVSREAKLNDVFRREFVHKLVKLSALRTLDICCRWKTRLNNKLDLMEDMVFGLQLMTKSKDLLNKERATIFFQPLVYALKDSLVTIEQKHNVCDMSPSCSLLLRTLLETIIDLVQSFDLTWQDSIETISVMDIACEFLQYDIWDQRVLVSLLRLLNLSLSKYMSPEMVLLMDNSKHSIVSQTGALLANKCNSLSWEVRDSALECVYTLSLNANSKFPAHRSILLDAELPQLVLQMALHDGEFYVRATAFKCLHELIQISEIWNVLINGDQFLEKLLKVFEHETEGLVRKEAVTLIHMIDKFQEFPSEMMPKVYDVMTHAVVGDLHWEVKCKALDFWTHTLKVYLQHQGMIDNKFPEVTFSKEHKKIMTLNQAEVRKRLIKVLNQLSYLGCLYSLKSACLDDCDVEVARKGSFIASKIAELYKSYEVPCDNIDSLEPPSPVGRVGNCIPSSVLSPAGSSTDSAPSPISSLDLQHSNLVYDPLTSFEIPPTPLNIDLLSPPASIPSNNTDQTAAQINRNQYVGPTANITNGMPFGEDQELQTQFKDNGIDHLQRDAIMEELLNSSDMSFLQKIYSPSDQVMNTASKMQTKQYLAPSEFLKFVYEHADQHSNEKQRWLDTLDEFDSLLDDILKEYNVVSDVNNMDCY